MKTRRTFIREASAYIVITCSGMVSFFLKSCTNIKYVKATVDKRHLIISKLVMADNNFVLVRYEKLPAPIYLNKENDASYKALLMLCTHKKCTLKPTGNFLTCPCHGSEFSNTGQVLKSPAEENLRTFPVSVDEENIYINL